MKTHDIVRGNVKHWLQKNKKPYQWLADELGVSQSMIQHMLLEKGAIPSNQIEVLSKIMNISMKDLIGYKSHSDNLTVQIRGQLDNRCSKQDLKAMLFEIEDYISLKN